MAGSWIPRDQLGERLLRVITGLLLFGFSDGLILLAALGVDPWDVLHQGLARTFGFQIGTWSIAIGALVLLAWLPLRQRPGPGTVLNVVVVGLAIDGTLSLVPAPHELWARVLVLLGGIGLNAVATGLYIGAGLGPGPRDGLMTGFAARGHSVRVVRTTIELTVLGIGFLLGGNVGIGTLLYALGIGPLVHWTIPWLDLKRRAGPAQTAEH